MRTVKVGKHEVLVLNQNGSQYVYLRKNLKLLIQFRQAFSLCSLQGIQGVYVTTDCTLLGEDFPKKFMDSYFNGRQLVTFQNSTKRGYDDAIAMGFRDTYRLPGSYTSGGSKITKGAKTSSTLAIMIYGNKPIKDAFKFTTDLISKSTGITPQPIKKTVVAVAKNPNVKYFLCKTPTDTLTQNKIYPSTNGNTRVISITNDNGRPVIAKMDRFEQVIF